MKKIPTIYERDWEGALGPPGRALTEVPNPECEWVFDGEGIATRKYDGTCCLIRLFREGADLYPELLRRYEVKVNPRSGELRAIPPGFEEVDRDEETGQMVGWLPVEADAADKWHREAFENLLAAGVPKEGTYELVGPRINGNPEDSDAHVLIRHAEAQALDAPREQEALRGFLAENDFEGIVWHHPDGRMAKIKGKDFGLKR